jgi:hypothetical protein
MVSYDDKAPCRDIKPSELLLTYLDLQHCSTIIVWAAVSSTDDDGESFKVSTFKAKVIYRFTSLGAYQSACQK